MLDVNEYYFFFSDPYTKPRKSLRIAHGANQGHRFFLLENIRRTLLFRGNRCEIFIINKTTQ